MAKSSLVTPLRALTTRRAVAWSVATGLVAWLLLRVLAPDILPVARFLVAWDIVVSIYLASVFLLLHDATPEDMARHAAAHHVGRRFVLGISIAALIISVAVIVFEIRSIGREPEHFQGLLVLFVLLTVALSWLFIHTSFATHYAFDYYGAHEDNGGIELPGGQRPDFWDFWNFSITIGLCFATADINITGRTIRRVSTLHGVVAFVFNTVILAGAVSFAGALLRPDGG